ncbi:hypothetical protein HTH_1667 [Hydrogenobacter thermophilus TK-6]|uniref:Uncharacterized protein n=1 Tax=Hydrogenobacter thermophilus (strain DSM 6534 / IAM 12695 / TK-6) TaxID=608538 RepID=D3DJW2_HYDTT|nr:hypothetical protein HTH_1667 [Hydrogenobacter thermophilus TK-6]
MHQPHLCLRILLCSTLISKFKYISPVHREHSHLKNYIIFHGSMYEFKYNGIQLKITQGMLQRLYYLSCSSKALKTEMLFTDF